MFDIYIYARIGSQAVEKMSHTQRRCARAVEVRLLVEEEYRSLEID